MCEKRTERLGCVEEQLRVGVVSVKDHAKVVGEANDFRLILLIRDFDKLVKHHNTTHLQIAHLRVKAATKVGAAAITIYPKDVRVFIRSALGGVPTLSEVSVLLTRSMMSRLTSFMNFVNDSAVCSCDWLSIYCRSSFTVFRRISGPLLWERRISLVDVHKRHLGG